MPSTAIAVRPRAVAESAEVLGVRATQAHNEVERGLKNVVGQAIIAGANLIQAKAVVPRGEFGSWLKQNFPASQKTASTYMRIAAEHERTGAAPTSLASGLKAICAGSERTRAKSDAVVPKVNARRSVGTGAGDDGADTERGIPELLHEAYWDSESNSPRVDLDAVGIELADEIRQYATPAGVENAGVVLLAAAVALDAVEIEG